MTRPHAIVLGSAIALALVVVAPAAHAKVIWRGDFSTGDLSQWTKSQEVSSGRLTVVSSPAPPDGAEAMRTIVEPGDSTSGGIRSEVVYSADRPEEGDERYYHWQTYWPEDYVSPDYWQIFTQWHQYVTGGSPPLAFLLIGDQMMLGSPTQYFWTAPLTRGVWHDFILHVVWSEDGSVGGVEIWYDKQHVLPFTHTATLFAGDSVYLKQGLYRKTIIDGEQVVYHSGMTIATSLDDVLPPPPVVEPSPAKQPEPEVQASAGAETGTTPAVGGEVGCNEAGEAVTLWSLAVGVALFLRRRRRRA